MLPGPMESRLPPGANAARINQAFSGTHWGKFSLCIYMLNPWTGCIGMNSNFSTKFLYTLYYYLITSWMPVRCYGSIYIFFVAWVNIVDKKIHKHSDLDVSIGQIKHNTPQQLTIPTKVIIHCNFKSSDVRITCQQFHTNFRKGIHKTYLYFLIHSIAYNCRKD
jgi:hypothetical protein